MVRKSALNVIVSPCHANAAGVPMHILRAAGRPVVETRAEHAQRGLLVGQGPGIRRVGLGG